MAKAMKADDGGSKSDAHFSHKGTNSLQTLEVVIISDMLKELLRISVVGH